MEVCDKGSSKNNRYINWITNYGPAAENVAKQLATTTENILALSALESGWGNGSYALTGRNNFFSLHSPAPFENGFVFTPDKKVKVATFSSFATCADGFAKAYGKYVYGIKDATSFATALQKAKKYAIYRDGTPVKSFVPDIVNTAGSFKARLACK